MLQKSKINSFVALGDFLNQFSTDSNQRNQDVLNNDTFFESFEALLALSQSHNGWFTKEQVYFAVNSWAEALTEANLNEWLSIYDFSKVTPKTVGLILAGNIPLVGFHDFLSVLISGHHALVKTSSK
ncbi:MAG: acyl-CoA reductase, partial [Flavobacterium sp.]|nr:acyl-CoA reductase [Flavobacterium sp.]